MSHKCWEAGPTPWYLEKPKRYFQMSQRTFMLLFLHSYFKNEVRENLTRSVLRSPEQYAVITHPFRFFLAINERSKTRLDVFSFVMVLKNLDITSCQQSDLQFKSPFTVTINADGQCSVSLLPLLYSYINRFCTIFWVPPLSSSMSRVQFRTRDNMWVEFVGSPFCCH